MKQFLALLFTAFIVSAGFSQDVAKGEELFAANCSACHKPDKRLIGPPLQGVAEKYNDIEYLTAFVHNSQELIKSGDERAVAVYEEYNKQIMTPFESLSQSDVVDILAYADSFSAPEVSASGVKIRPISAQPSLPFKPLYFMQNLGAWVLYFVGVAVLLVFLLQLVTVNDITDIVRHRDDDEVTH